MTKSKTFNRFQHRCAEYAQANRKTITNGMALTLSAIAHFLNARTLSCFPSYETLAAYAEVDRMWTQRIEGRGNSWRHPAQILLRRLDYVYATLIATNRETVVFDPVRLWDYATRKAAA